MQPPDFGAATHRERWSWRNHPLVSLLIASCIGITLDRHLAPESATCWWVAAVAAWLIWWISWRLNRSVLSSWMLILCVANSMALWHHVYWNLYPSNHLVRYTAAEPVPVALRCRARSVPELTGLPPVDPLTTIPRGVTSQLLVDATHLRNAGQWSAVSGKVEVWISGHLLGVLPGDELQVFGDLSGLPEPLNPGERDWGQAARSDRIVCRLSVPYPDCVSVRKRAAQGPLSMIGALRPAVLRQLDRFVGAPRSVLAGGGHRRRASPPAAQMAEDL